VGRRQFCASVAAWAASSRGAVGRAAEQPPYRYIVASALYGMAALDEILPEVRRCGAEFIDIWPRPHGNQREQVDAMGADAFAEQLQRHNVKLGALSQYPRGPFRLKPDMQLARRLGGPAAVVVTGGRGPPDLTGSDLKAAVMQFAERLKPHIAEAEETQTIVAIENHSHNLMSSPDACLWLVERLDSPHLGIAVAPHHLPQDAHNIARFITQLGEKVAFFYAQQHGRGSDRKMPKHEELEQMPGRGPLDFAPIMSALCASGYRGFVEIFTHPVPRGVPILETPARITAEVNRARRYLDACVQRASQPGSSYPSPTGPPKREP